MSNLSASSLYLFLIVTSVTPATSATSLWVLRSPQRIDEIYIDAAATPVGPRPLVSSLSAASFSIYIDLDCTSPDSLSSLQNLEM
jgi:hypothetical protein